MVVQPQVPTMSIGLRGQPRGRINMCLQYKPPNQPVNMRVREVVKLRGVQCPEKVLRPLTIKDITS